MTSPQTPVIIAKCPVADIEHSPYIVDLVAEYTAESSTKGLPTPQPRWDMYQKLEDLGLLQVIKATAGDELIGFIFVLTSILPHYGVGISTSESFFVAQKHRHTRAGLLLLKAAEKHAHDVGSPGLIISAPFGGKLHELLPKVGYRESNRVFFKSTLDE